MDPYSIDPKKKNDILAAAQAPEAETEGSLAWDEPKAVISKVSEITEAGPGSNSDGAICSS